MSAVELVARDIRISRSGTTFDLDGLRVDLPVFSDELVEPSVSKIRADVAAGIPLAQAIAAAEVATVAEQWRMEPKIGRPGVLVLNDAAEATPVSMSSALKTLAELALDGSRSVAVLGEMTDVGDEWQDEHDRIGRLVVRLNIAKLVVVGHGARHIHNAAGLEGSWDGESVLVATAEEAYDLLKEELREGDVVLVKSSAEAGLAALGDTLGGAVA